MDYSEFLVAIKRIEERRYIESHRTGDTGVGKTLEDLVHITENNIAGREVPSVEK